MLMPSYLAFATANDDTTKVARHYTFEGRVAYSLPGERTVKNVLRNAHSLPKR